MRSQLEIVERLHATSELDILGFKLGVLIYYLDFEHAREFLKPETEAEAWTPARVDPLVELGNYLQFAWGKVIDHRGISAGRSIDKMEEWLWLAGKDDLLQAVEGTGYENYGAPKLRLICEELGLPWPSDDGAVQNMSEGRECVPYCAIGCGCG